MQLAKGHIFEGRYRIQGELGRGGFGMVYKAYQVGMDRHVALKVLNPEINEQAARTARERFLREVRIISKLRHPNTVTIHDFGETVEGMVYMVLEYVDGETLKDVLKRRGALDEQRTLRIGQQIAKSLAEAHRHGIIHRDLKPANIMLSELGGEADFVKVLDFGVARLRGGRQQQGDDLTSVGLPEGERELIGTPRYMSPEQVKGEELTGASDVYSLGLMLYEMLSGEPAVVGDTTMMLITQQISPEPLRLPNIARIHPSLQQIVRRATQKSLQHRYRSVDVLAQEMEAALQGLNRISTSGGYAQPGFASQSNDFILGNQYEGYQQPSGQWPQAQPQTQTQNFQTGGGPGWGGASNTPSGQMMAPQMPSGQHQAFGQDDYGRPPGFMTNPSGMHPVVAPNAAAPQPHYNTTGQFPAQAPATHQSNFHQQPQGLIDPNNMSGMRQEWGDLDSESTTPAMPSLQRNAPMGAPAFSGLGDLPPVPNENDNPFAVPNQQQPPDLAPLPGSGRATGRHAAQRPPRRDKSSNPDEGVGQFTFSLLTLILASAGLVVGLYLVFIILGAALSQIIGGPIRFIVAVIAALVIPTVPLVAEGGKRERFQVVDSKLNRMRRAVGVGVAGALSSCLLVCFAMPEPVITSLRTDPNWFLDGERDIEGESRPAQLNRQVSIKAADAIEQSMVGVGMYKPKPDAKDVIEANKPPESTRHKVKNKLIDGKKKKASDEPSDEDTSSKDTPAIKPKAKGPEPTRRRNRSAIGQKSSKSKGGSGSTSKADKVKRADEQKKNEKYEEW